MGMAVSANASLTKMIAVKPPSWPQTTRFFLTPVLKI